MKKILFLLFLLFFTSTLIFAGTGWNIKYNNYTQQYIKICAAGYSSWHTDVLDHHAIIVCPENSAILRTEAHGYPVRGIRGVNIYIFKNFNYKYFAHMQFAECDNNNAWHWGITPYTVYKIGSITFSAGYFGEDSLFTAYSLTSTTNSEYSIKNMKKKFVPSYSNATGPSFPGTVTLTFNFYKTTQIKSTIT